MFYQRSPFVVCSKQKVNKLGIVELKRQLAVFVGAVFTDFNMNMYIMSDS